MAYLLGYRSAIEWLRLNPNPSLVAQQWALPPYALEGSRHKLQLHAEDFAQLTYPLHLIVGTRENRRPSAEAICHLLTSPDGTYPGIRVARAAYCSTPAFAFLQMANVLDVAELCFLGMELCGRYGIDKGGKLFLRQQGCSPQELEGMAQSMTGVRGRKRAGEVAVRVVAGSASPMETALALILCATRAEGGFGLPWPKLNHSIPVEGAARELWDDEFITPDMLWEDARLAIEYDSNLHHTAAHRISRDASRRNVLEEMGYRVISVTADHLRTPRELVRIAGIVARSTASELTRPDDETWARMLAWQLRMRELAEHPDLLLGPQKEARPATRDWHSHIKPRMYGSKLLRQAEDSRGQGSVKQ